ncbi:uncharacterized protein LOC103962171 isoform X3 [Pyrus x bretschneideri]|uniref:uncharacterized protein LOC103962171 isoform X3 n=1 Tax=Pyrus x bretschneideri TaxID=225117 RepID=UPI00087085A2|nr:uncharacterized protein LOC103962171 isoform X3 [Pyrus x bretschneideri]
MRNCCNFVLPLIPMNKTSIIVDASKYIEELKRKVDAMSQGVGTSQNSITQNSLPAQVTVETLEKGFQIHVLSEKNCPGLLVSILEAFEELGLDVLDARVSCSDTFQLEAVGEAADSIDAQAVKEAVLQAIQTWSTSSEQD